MTTPSPYALEAINIGKRFGALVALDNVSLQLRRSSVHALLGENGAGKSTLVKCIMGYYRPDEGQVLFGDREQSITSPHEAHLLGIGMVYQHFTLIPNMTVAENLVLARPRLPAVLNWRAELAQLERQMKTMPFQVPLTASVNTLAAGEKQKVEIIKQLLLNPKVLILDEPTSVLTPNEADEVLTQVRAMTRARELSVLIITHKFREVMHYADDVTVLRKGKFIGSTTVAEATPQSLATMMVGRATIATPLQRERNASDEVVLEIDGLHVENDIGVEVVRALSLTLRRGEIVGIAGVSGNGQKQLVEVLAGQRMPLRGSVRIDGMAYHATRLQMHDHKLRCLPEEPLRNACVASMSVADNLALRRFDQTPYCSAGGMLHRKVFRRTAQEWIASYGIRTPGTAAPIGNLSGGNVQRSVLARELSDAPRILIAANPCFGLDFSAVAEIHNRIMAARNDGAAVLLVSEDLDEILEMSDRVMVISGGTLVHETTPANADMTRIGQYMAGH
ncbi:MAG: ABC transporter ATP-binding protein [Gammaproteobacteria bacterium]|nr:ABC transporter ATP-binding protein [Gammaproteobacteria bacterium]